MAKQKYPQTKVYCVAIVCKSLRKYLIVQLQTLYRKLQMVDTEINCLEKQIEKKYKRKLVLQNKIQQLHEEIYGDTIKADEKVSHDECMTSTAEGTINEESPIIDKHQN